MTNQHTILLMLALALTLALLLPSVYIFLAWILVGKVGAWSLLPWWLAFVVALSALMHRDAYPKVLLLVAAAYGVSTVVVWRSYHQRTGDAFTLSVLGRAIAAFYGVIAIVFFVNFVVDARRVFFGG